MFRPIYNFFIVSFFILFVLIYGVLTDIFVWDEVKRLKLRAWLLHRITMIGTKLIGIKITYNKSVNTQSSYFIVSNHLSYLDIIIISSLSKTVFVSTTEVSATKFFGRVARYGGSIFVDRKNRLKVKDDMHKIRSVLQNDTNIVVFLEGTTSNGDGVLPFKPSFLEVVFQTDKPVLGLCIKYKTFNGKPINEDSRELIYYYGDHKLVGHLVRFLLSLKSLEVEVKEAGLFLTKDYPSRKELANHLHKEISALYAS